MSDRPTPEHVWVFDSNRRIYPPTPSGRLWASGGPIYREHWVKRKVTGETRVSFLIDNGTKVPKRGGRGFAFTLDEVEDDVWRHDHRHKIANLIDRIEPQLLRKIAEMIGYTPTPP
jgi:hypothetical protein